MDVRIAVIGARRRASPRNEARLARTPGSDDSAGEDIPQVDGLQVISGEEDVEREHRVGPIGPYRHVRDLRSRGDVGYSEDRRVAPSGPLGDIHIEKREQERRRWSDGDLAGVVI